MFNHPAGFLIPGFHLTVCSNGCSSHGTCLPNDTCDCSFGFDGPDCGQCTDILFCPMSKLLFTSMYSTHMDLSNICKYTHMLHCFVLFCLFFKVKCEEWLSKLSETTKETLE